MTAQAITVPFGASMPPQGPHTITTNLGTWKNSMKLLEGDQEIMGQIKSLYPRFMPMGPVRDVSIALYILISSLHIIYIMHMLESYN